MGNSFVWDFESRVIAESLLGLKPPYSAADVNKAYRKAMLACHPDTCTDRIGAEAATDQAARVNWARTVLLEHLADDPRRDSPHRDCSNAQSQAKTAPPATRRIDGRAVAAVCKEPAGGNGALIAGALAFGCALDCIAHVYAYSVLGVGQGSPILALDLGHALSILWTYVFEPPFIFACSLVACLLARSARAQHGGALPGRARTGRVLGWLSVLAFVSFFVALNATYG